MNPFVYRPGTSLLHRADAVSKLVWLLTVAVTAILVSSLPLILVLFVVVAALGLACGRLPIGAFLRRLAYPAFIAVWLFVFLAVSTAGADQPALLAVGPLHVTATSLEYGAALGIRILTLAAASTIFVLTTDPRRMVEEVIKFGHLPYRAGFAIYAALRFLPLLQSEARAIRHAHAVRADLSARGGPIGRLGEIRRLTVPLLAGALRRVHLTAIAMDARGFGAHRTRTDVELLTRHPVGRVLVIGQLVLFAAAVYLQFVVGIGHGGFLRGPVSGG